MSESKKLNNYVVSLQDCQSGEEYDRIFSELYAFVTRLWRSDGVIESLAHQYRMDTDDTLSIASIKLYEIVGNYTPSNGDFYNYLSVSISNACRRFAKDRNKHDRQKETSFEYAMEDDPNLVKFIPHANADNEEFDDYVKESEQRQLLAQLLGKADDKCRQAVEAFRKTGNYYGAAKLLGIDDKTVKRRIEKVAKQFNRHQFGNIYDYFTVPTEPNVSERSQTQYVAV